MNLLFLTLLLQSTLLLPPRTAIENPATTSAVPPRLSKDYGKMWARFVSGKEDAALSKDLDKFLQKEKTFDPACMIAGYLALYKGNDSAAQEKFTEALKINPSNRIAIYYLAELAFAKSDYARASALYSQLTSLGAETPELETKRQKAFLLATDSLLRSAARAEAENHLSEAEKYYRQALTIVPDEAVLHIQLADLLDKQNKAEEAAAERKAAEDLVPRRNAVTGAAKAVKGDSLEELGRWGNDIELFRQIKDAQVLTREQFATLIVRYFPQVTEFPHVSKIVTDIQNSPARSEIQIVTSIGLVEPFPNHNFVPSAPMTRGEFARALARLSRLIGLPVTSASPASAADVGPTNAMYPDIQLVLGSGVMTLQDTGAFEAGGYLTGAQAVSSVDRLLRTFQQVQH